MASLYDLVEKIQKGDTDALEQMVKKFKPKVNKLLSQTSYQNQEDLRQELLLSIIIKSKYYKLDEVPGFEEFKEKIV